MPEPASLLGLTRLEMRDALAAAGLPKWRADQIWEWIYVHGATSFDQMTNLPQELRCDLPNTFSIVRPKIVRHERSADGTEKFALQLFDAEVIEMVFIPEGERGTLCISSQVGCAVQCAFCFTGTQGFTRNLTASEIVGQVLCMRDALNDTGSAKQKRALTNIVLMGMGEPLHNYPAVLKAMHIMMDPKGAAFSKRRITLSTSGVAPLIRQCGQDLGVNLAISLHAPNNTLRSQIMPINRQFPVEELIAACRDYPGVNPARRITFEYVMLDGINDTDACARELSNILEGIPAKINLIPWNPWPNAPFSSSPPERIDTFAKMLTQAGYMVMVRTPRGQDISAACGQLKTKGL